MTALQELAGVVDYVNFNAVHENRRQRERQRKHSILIGFTKFHVKVCLSLSGAALAGIKVALHSI